MAFTPNVQGSRITGSLTGITSISAVTISATTLYGNGSNLTGISGGFTGGTVTGATSFTAGLTANTFSATTYQNLPTDIRVTGATYSNNIFTFSNNTGGTFNVLFNTVTGLTSNGNLTVTGNTFVSGSSTTVGDIRGYSLVSTQSINDEGGEVRLATPQTNSTLSGGNITFDVYQNKLRFFESGGSNRGVYIDLTAAGAGVSTNLLSGGGGEINTASNLGSGTGLYAQKVSADLQFKSLTSTGGTVTIGNNSTTVNLEVVPASNFTGGTVSGPTRFTNGLTANTISATTSYFDRILVNTGATMTPSNPERLLVSDGGAGGSSFSNIIVGIAEVNSYAQLNIINDYAGSNASTDIVATSDVGTESSKYIDMGINSSVFTGSTSDGSKANDAYLFSTGNDLWIGNASTGRYVMIHTDGQASGNTRIEISSGTTKVKNTFVITSTPVNNNSNTQVLTRNSITGNIEYTDVTAISTGATGTFNYGLVYAMSNQNYLM